MEYGYSLEVASPPAGRVLEELKAFLTGAGLGFASGIEHTALVRDGGGRIAAAASLAGNVVKCVAVDPALQGEGLTATLLTALRQKALAAGRRRLFLYTKPENRPQFTALGFHEVARAGEAVLMEDRRDGFDQWVQSIRSPAARGIVGAAVLNCNPMTLGHKYLIEEAARACGFLYVLVVSEDRSAVPAADRRAIVEAVCRDMPSVAVAGTGEYLISSATFPDYFLKDRTRAGAVWADLDIAVFCRLARTLGVTRRFVGSEPFCPVTAAYNRAMAAALPEQGVELVELDRLERGGQAVSATAVRGLVRAGRWRETEPLVPAETFAWLAREENRRLLLERAGLTLHPPRARRRFLPLSRRSRSASRRLTRWRGCMTPRRFGRPSLGRTPAPPRSWLTAWRRKRPRTARTTWGCWRAIPRRPVRRRLAPHLPAARLRPWTA